MKKNLMSAALAGILLLSAFSVSCSKKEEKKKEIDPEDFFDELTKNEKAVERGFGAENSYSFPVFDEDIDDAEFINLRIEEFVNKNIGENGRARALENVKYETEMSDDGILTVKMIRETGTIYCPVEICEAVKTYPNETEIPFCLTEERFSEISERYKRYSLEEYYTPYTFATDDEEFFVVYVLNYGYLYLDAGELRDTYGSGDLATLAAVFDRTDDEAAVKALLGVECDEIYSVCAGEAFLPILIEKSVFEDEILAEFTVENYPATEDMTEEDISNQVSKDTRKLSAYYTLRDLDDPAYKNSGAARRRLIEYYPMVEKYDFYEFNEQDKIRPRIEISKLIQKYTDYTWQDLEEDHLLLEYESNIGAYFKNCTVYYEESEVETIEVDLSDEIE